MGLDDISSEGRRARLEAQLAKKAFTIRSKDGDVTVVVNGSGNLVRIEIDPEAARNIRASNLAATVTEAIKSGRAKVAQVRELAMQRL